MESEANVQYTKFSDFFNPLCIVMPTTQRATSKHVTTFTRRSNLNDKRRVNTRRAPFPTGHAKNKERKSTYDNLVLLFSGSYKYQSPLKTWCSNARVDSEKLFVCSYTGNTWMSNATPDSASLSNRDGKATIGAQVVTQYVYRDRLIFSITVYCTCM